MGDEGLIPLANATTNCHAVGSKSVYLWSEPGFWDDFIIQFYQRHIIYISPCDHYWIWCPRWSQEFKISLLTDLLYIYIYIYIYMW